MLGALITMMEGPTTINLAPGATNNYDMFVAAGSPGYTTAGGHRCACCTARQHCTIFCFAAGKCTGRFICRKREK